MVWGDPGVLVLWPLTPWSVRSDHLSTAFFPTLVYFQWLSVLSWEGVGILQVPRAAVAGFVRCVVCAARLLWL